jgi:hypothetical protein
MEKLKQTPGTMTDVEFHEELGIEYSDLTSRLNTILNSRKLYDAFNNIPDRFLIMSDQDLISHVKPVKSDWKIRMRLWELISKALDDRNDYYKIFNRDIFDMILCSRDFYGRLQRPGYVAFIFRPIASHLDELEIMINVTRQHMWDIVNNLSVIEEGKVNHANAKMLMQIHNKLLDRKADALRTMLELRKERGGPGDTAFDIDDIDLLDAEINSLKGAK